MHTFDKSSKWLIEHHGDSIVRLAHRRRLKSWRPLQAELTHPRQLPDGLLEVRWEDEPQDDLFLLEVATYPEKRVYKPILRDLSMVFMDRGVLPETAVLVLRPRGKFRVQSEWELASRLGLTNWRVQIKVIEVWTLSAEELLAWKDPGVLPFVPLADFTGPPEFVFRKCRDEIENRGSPEETPNLLAVTQALVSLRFHEKSLFDLLGGSKAIMETPLIQEIEARRSHKHILAFLEARFGAVPETLESYLRKISTEKKLLKLTALAASCDSPEAFLRELREMAKSARKPRI